VTEELCPECGTNIFSDYKRGERVCESGHVIEDRLPDDSGNSGKLSPGSKPGGFTRKYDRDHAGRPVVAPRGIERQDPDERADNKIRETVLRICNTIQPPDRDAVAAGAILLYRRYLKEKLAKKLPTPVERKYLAAATVLFVCRERRVFCDIRTLCSQVAIPQRTMHQYTRLLQRLRLPALVSSTDYVAPFCSLLALDWKVQRLARDLLNGRAGNPRSLAATAIIMAAEQLGVHIKVKEVADATGVRAESISRTRRRF